MLADFKIHEHAGMAAESLLQEGARNFSCVVRQQLRFDAMDPRGLLQGLNDVSQQPLFYLAPVRLGRLRSIAHEEVSNHALALFVNEKGVSKNTAAFDGGVARQNFGIHVAQNHLGGNRIVPCEQSSPHGDLFVEQGLEVCRGEMSKIENFHTRSKEAGRAAPVAPLLPYPVHVQLLRRNAG